MRAKHACVISVLLVIMFFSISEFLFTELDMRRQQTEFDVLVTAAADETAEKPAITSAAADITEETAVPENAERFAALIDRNPDFAAWISISGTGISYPVMLTPDDPDYYLRRNFDKEDSVSGTPYIGSGCDTESDNIIIYGHNMKNGTMFSDLLLYENEGFYTDHPVIEFDTVDESSGYEVIAAFRDKVHFQDEEGIFRYYDFAGALSESGFNEYISEIKARSLYETDSSAYYGEKLLTLSTCAYHTKNGRFVLVAVKKH